ncbi:hypothetical protein IE53DRAFT_133013 [Violaceomyces palustris]|uniref:Uncharacterized protein n=1 Tax=Violaceomyces palustris TaxID=1673888 RepID=A0ACD0NV33_9BASI|nr:hypothetical protein IE53DRAFT_133013 [Violaceomyces palustris]
MRKVGRRGGGERWPTGEGGEGEGGTLPNHIPLPGSTRSGENTHNSTRQMGGRGCGGRSFARGFPPSPLLVIFFWGGGGTDANHSFLSSSSLSSGQVRSFFFIPFLVVGRGRFEREDIEWERGRWEGIKKVHTHACMQRWIRFQDRHRQREGERVGGRGEGEDGERGRKRKTQKSHPKFLFFYFFPPVAGSCRSGGGDLPASEKEETGC